MIATREEHVITFYSPGTFFDECTMREVKSWDTLEAAVIAKTITERYGAKPFAFEFSTHLVADPIPDGQGGSLRVEPREIKRSCRHFIGGELWEYDAIDKIADSSSLGGVASVEILLSNMRGNGWPIVLVNNNSFRTVRPFEETDLVVDTLGVIVRRGDEPRLIEKRREYLARWRAAV